MPDAQPSAPEIPEPWRELFDLDHEMNRRGMPLDLDAVGKLIVVRDRETLRLGHRFKQLTENELASPKQNARLKAKLATLGVELDNLQRETLESWVAANPKRDDLAAQLVRTALEWSHSSDAKLSTFLAAAKGSGRVRDTFVLHGAHTGRWAGKGAQLQNLKKVTVADPEALLGQLLERADAIVAKTVDPSLDPGWPLSIKEAIAEFCWISGQDDKLALYRDGKDVYVAEAAALGSDSRDLGKLFVLSAGYGASGRVIFTRALGFGVLMAENEAYEKTALWRANNPAIVDFWHRLFRVLCAVIELPPGHEPTDFHGLTIWRDEAMLLVQLPSGRCLKYRDPHLTLNSHGLPVLNVKLPKNKKLLPVSLWHGAATENVVQAIAYDVLVADMLAMHRDGIFLVASIHDEIVALAPIEEAEAVRARMIEIMQTPPEWAPDLPLAADGFINTRFIRPPKPLHAPLAPSAAERWMNCPGSVSALQALPEAPESPFATEGTEAHRIFAACLERGVDPSELTTDPLVLQPMQRALEIADDIIAGRRFVLEQRLEPLPGLAKVWGTADVLVFDQHGRVEDVIDLKFGTNVTVEPDSLQLQLYALLAVQAYGCDPRSGVCLHIIQPRRQHRSGPHRVHQMRTSGLSALFSRLRRAVEAIEAPGAPREAGKWCRYCAVRENCREAQVQPGYWKPSIAEQMRELAHVLSD